MISYLQDTFTMTSPLSIKKLLSFTGTLFFLALKLLIVISISTHSSGSPLTPKSPINTKDCIKINHIDINPQNIYDEKKRLNLIESTLNFFHYTTRISTIQDELLFKQGECFDQALLEETERNLRATNIFSYAYVTSAVNGGQRDVTITTTDRFTLRLEASAGITGKSTKTRLSFGEQNFLGLNKNLNYTTINESNKKRKTRIAFASPRTFHKYALNALYVTSDNNALQRYTVTKPFNALADRHQYLISYFKDDTDSTFVIPNQNNINIPQLTEYETLGYQWELGSAKNSRRLGLSLSNSETAYFPMKATVVVPSSVYIPPPTKTVDITTSLAWRDRYKFKVMRGIDSLISDEDIELQQSANAGLGLQLRDEKGTSHLHNTLFLGYGGANFPTKSLLTSYQINTGSRYFAGQLREVNINAFFHSYYFRSAVQSYVSSIAYRYAYSRDELNLPISIGADVGLRGHQIDSITGNKSIIINLEHRYKYPYQNRYFAIGQTFFIDAGYAWQ